MADQQSSDAKRAQDEEYMKGGRGRKDEVGGSGIYPASSSDAPGDAVIRSEGELAHHSGPRRKPTADERE